VCVCVRAYACVRACVCVPLYDLFLQRSGYEVVLIDYNR
jgi:cytochrome c oxidase assembly protein Cox11